MKIAICIPVHRTVEAKFSESLANMVAATMTPTVTYNGAVTRPQIRTATCDEGGLEYKRTRLALDALKAGADYILWCDSDHIFPDDSLLRLLKHDLAIVGCNYVRRASLAPTAFNLQGAPLFTTQAKAEAAEVEEVGGLGFGLLLMKAPVFAHVPKPWFASEVLPDGRMGTGEDLHFCNQARLAGLRIHVDHGLSWQVGHLASRIALNSDIEKAGDAAPKFSEEGALPAADRKKGARPS